LVDTDRVWERRRADGDFAEVRVGVGSGPTATALRPAATRAGAEPDPVAGAALRHFLDTYAAIPGLPVTLSLAAGQRVRIHGHRRAATDLVRAMVAQLATFHAPDDLRIAVCADPHRRADWEWVKWLPHAGHPTRTDGAGALRLVASSPARLADLVATLPAGPERPHLVVVCDRPGTDPADMSSVADAGVLCLDGAAPGPGAAGTVLEVGARLRSHRAAGWPAGDAVPDRLTRVEAEALARRLAPLRLAGEPGGPGPGAAGPAGLPELLGLGPPDRFDPAMAWAPRPPAEQLRVPIGTGVDGGAVELDLKESAAGGMGPHGLLVGATGSGKSELLRTIVLGLAATHSSEQLNLVLVDFKGGATFASLDRLPHTAAVITNLAGELPLVDRMADALNGELVRRQELLRRAGNYPGRAGYERARAEGAPLAPLPVLLVACDEFSELLSAKPEFIDLFVQIGRVGRSLGVHLLLASQRLEEGRLRGLDTHLSYRIGLRTFSALESRAVLGVPDAHQLPPEPGHGYLAPGTGELVRFRAAYASGSGPPASSPGDAGPAGCPGDALPAVTRVVPYGTREVPATGPDPGGAPAGPSVLDLLVGRMAGAGPAAHQVWLPPLAEPPALGELLGPVARDPARGLGVTDPALRGALRVPVALVDRPLQQRRDPLWLSLAGAGGHVAVVGGPRAGKSTAVSTLVCALALTHTPAEVQVYCLDFGGGSLAVLRDLPHVGGVAGRLDTAAVRRTVAQVATLLSGRERRGGDRDDPYGEVFLVVDGWSTLRGEYEDLEPVMADLAARGLSYGVHVVATAARWLDFRPAVREVFGSRLELQLGDPADSIASRRAAAAVPASPGRGVTPDGLHLLTALPRLAGTDLVTAVASAWRGPPAPPVRLLPAEVDYRQMAPGPAGADRAAGLRLPVGVAEADLGPVVVDFAAEPHLLAFGDSGCGKSSFLRALAVSLTRRFEPSRARLVLLDYRRSLLGAVTTEHLIGYGSAAEPATGLIESVASYLRRRLPGPQVTPGQLRERSWWQGPECFVLVDDYDLVAAGGPNPLLPLLPYLPQARDVGLHLVLARRSGGAARAMYEPVLQRLRELATPGLVMSGDPDEGPLVGSTRPQPMPPGRGWLATRREGVRLVQLAYLPPD
jgi:S-DNA-T family DNA segregation ATPase FtsK/SpoIIIE